MTTLSENLGLCLEWAKTNGAYVDECLEFTFDKTSGISAFVRKPIQNGKGLISVPTKLLITTDLSTKFFGIHKSPTNNPNALLQLYLAKLKFDNSPDENKSFFQPYLDVLPEGKLVNSPYFWTAAEIELLKGTDLYIKIARNLKQLVAEWYEVVGEVKALGSDDEAFYKDVQSNSSFDFHSFINDSSNFKWHNFPAYLWSNFIFTSRAFPQLIFDSSRLENVNQAFLYPVVDLLNHENGKKVRWEFDRKNEAVVFSTSETLKADDELFNNYGDKSNEELLLGYGFCLEKNDFDITTITLKLPPNVIPDAQSYGIALNSDDIVGNSINFQLSLEDPLPGSLISLFAFICKLNSEDISTTRSTLEGLDKLAEILDQKLLFLKQASKISSVSVKNPKVIKQAKTYLNTQKRIFQQAFDSVARHQKRLLKMYKPLSFKSIIKSDKKFADSLLLAVGINGYEDIVTKKFLQQALLLWIIRASNGDAANEPNPDFIIECFNKLKSSITINREDVQEYMPLYKSLFPGISTKIPEVYGRGDWGIKQFIIAGTVIDHLVWTRRSTQEAFFLKVANTALP